MNPIKNIKFYQVYPARQNSETFIQFLERHINAGLFRDREVAIMKISFSGSGIGLAYMYKADNVWYGRLICAPGLTQDSGFYTCTSGVVTKTKI